MVAIVLMAVSSAAPMFIPGDYDMPMAGLAILLNLPFIISAAPLLAFSSLSYVLSNKINFLKEKTMLTLSRSLLIASLLVFIYIGLFILPLWGVSLLGYLAVLAAAVSLVLGFYILSKLDSEIKALEQVNGAYKTSKKIPSWVWLVGIIVVLFMYQHIIRAINALTSNPSLLAVTILIAIGGVAIVVYVRDKVQKQHP